MFVSLDANFGLVRKKGAGSSESHRVTPNHGTKMFMKTPEVTTPVSSSISHVSVNVALFCYLFYTYIHTKFIRRLSKDDQSAIRYNNI